MARWNDRIEERTGLPILTIPFYDEHYEVVPTLEKYVCGGLAIELWELETGDPWSTLTVNLGVGNDRAQTIDTNNNHGPICEYLEEVGVAKRNGMTVRSGFCEYPVMVFDEEFLDTLSRFKF